MDWLGFLEVQGSLESFQHHGSTASILQHSAFFIVQLSHPYITGKTIALTRQIFVDKVMKLAVVYVLALGLERMNMMAYYRDCVADAY